VGAKLGERKLYSIYYNKPVINRTGVAVAVQSHVFNQHAF